MNPKQVKETVETTTMGVETNLTYICPRLRNGQVFVQLITPWGWTEMLDVGRGPEEIWITRDCPTQHAYRLEDKFPQKLADNFYGEPV